MASRSGSVVTPATQALSPREAVALAQDAIQYNHYSLLASIEDVFRLTCLGYAQTAGLHRFGLDIDNTAMTR